MAKIDTSDEGCALVCMIVSNPNGSMRKDGDGWQRRVNDLIRALRDERNDLLRSVKILEGAVTAEKNANKPERPLRRRG